MSQTSNSKVTTKTVSHMSNLAHIPLTSDEESVFAKQFDETLDVIQNLKELDVSKVNPTHQVTGQTNVWRDDVPQPELSFSQKEALANSAHTHQGYFVVPNVFGQEGGDEN